MHALSNYFKNEAITNRYFASIFDDKDDDNLLNNNELDKYLNTDKVPIAPPGAQPLV
ncbi:2387_t:CDS:2 [Racocetra fulgida]|uniref:2387_t:CDS:1 n=1 Tax=Racocetra fulgida TaxID=60492 RepID=A0A9N9A636_9GLOM|nr:2387_t:CDS:2 [Racocetra fulgida]